MASGQITAGSKSKSRRQKFKQCCRTFRICMDRLPFWSLSSFLLCVVGITMFSGGLYATAEQVIKQLDLPVISVAIWGLFVLHVVIAAFFLLVAALSTGETRREASNLCRFCNLLGRWCLIGNIITAYILHFIWYLLPLALFFPTGIAVGGGIACHVTPQCINLTERGVPQLVIDHIKPSEYVQYVRSFNASHYDQYIDQAEGFVETAINSLESSPMLDQIITFVEKNIPSENETDALIGQIVKTIDPDRIAAMLDTMQERVDEGLDMFEEAGQTVAARIEEIDLSQLDKMMGELFNNTKDFNLTAFIEEYGEIDESFFEQIANATDSAFDTLDEYATLNGTMPYDPATRARQRRHLLSAMIAAERRRRYRRSTVESKSEEEQQREQLTDELLRRLEDADAGHSTAKDRDELEAILKKLELTPEETKKLMTTMKTDAEAKREEARALIEKGISRGENRLKKIEDAYNDLQNQTLEHIKHLQERLETVNKEWTAKQIESRAQELARRIEALGISSADGFKSEYKLFLEQNGARFSEYLRLSSEIKAEVIRQLSESKNAASDEGQKLKQTLEKLDLRPEDIEALLNMGTETSDETRKRADEILNRHLKRIASNRQKLNEIAQDLEHQVHDKLRTLQEKYALSEINTEQLENQAEIYIERLRNLNETSLNAIGDELRKFLASKGVKFPDFGELAHAVETEMLRRVFELRDTLETKQLQAMLEELGMSRENATKLLDFGMQSTEDAKRKAKELLEDYLAKAWSKEDELKKVAQLLEDKVMQELEKLRAEWLSEYEGLTEEIMERNISELARRAFRLSGGNIDNLDSQTKHFLAQYGIVLPPDVQLVDGLRDELLARLKTLDGLATAEATRLRDMLLKKLGITETQVEDLLRKALNSPDEVKSLLNGYLNEGLAHKERLEAMAEDLQKQLLIQIDDLRRQVLENVGNLTTDMIEQKAKELAARVNDLTGGHLQNLHENARQFLEQYGGQFSDYAVLGAAIKDELLRRLHTLKDALPEDIKNVEVMLANVGLGREEIDILLDLAQGNTDGAKERAKAFLEEGMRRGLEQKERLEKVAKELEKKVLEEVENLRLTALNAQAKGQEFAAAAQVRAIELARRVQELSGGGVEGMTEEARRFLEKYGGRFSNYEELAANVKDEIMRRISELQNTSTAQAKELQEMLMKEMGLKRDEALQLLELGKSHAARAQAEARALLDKGLKRGHELKEKLEQVAKELEQQVLKEVEELQRQAREKFGELTGKAGELGAELEERARDLARRVQELSGGNPENMTEEVRKFLEQRGAHFLEDAREVYKQLGSKLEEAKRQARELAREMQAAARQMAKDAKKAAQKAAVEAAILLQRAEELSRQAAMEVDAVKKLAAEQAAAKAREAANAARGMATSAFSKARDVVKNADVLLKTAASGALGQLREIAKNLRRYVSEFIGHARYYVDEGATLARQTARMLETNRDVIADTYVQYAGLTQHYLEIVKVGNDTYCSNNKDALCYEVKKAGVGMVFVFLSCFVIKISMIHFLMCMSANYVHLKREEEMERYRLMELLDKDQQDYDAAQQDKDVNFMMSDTGSLVEGFDKQSI